MKRIALYMRVSSLDQRPESQLYDLQQLASQRGYEIVKEYTDKISGAKARRPALDALLYDARRRRFDVVMVWAFDRMARSVRHLLSVLDELGQLNIEFVSFRENIDTGGALGRAMVVIVGAIAELERNLITERVRAGMRRARLEGIQLGRRPLDVDRAAIVSDRLSGMSLTNGWQEAWRFTRNCLPTGEAGWWTSKHASALYTRTPQSLCIRLNMSGVSHFGKTI